MIDRPAIETLRAEFRARLDAAATDRDLDGLDAAFLSRKSGSTPSRRKSNRQSRTSGRPSRRRAGRRAPSILRSAVARSQSGASIR
jgi:hypothetical protein